MRSPFISLAIGVLVAVLSLAGAHAPRAYAAPALALPILPPAPPPERVIAPVAEPIAVDPAGRVRGTMIMVHAGGWAGHDANAQQLLVRRPGDVFLQRGWRVISVDYNEGTDSLQDVLDSAGGELARKTGDGPLCIYGESAGAHLALVAAARLHAIDCVIGLGTPTDLALYEAEAPVSADQRMTMIAARMVRFFGSTPEQIAPWSPVALAPTIHADVLLLHEGDDTVVPAAQGEAYEAASPTTQLVELEPGDPNDPATDFVHGTISDVGRARYAAALRSVVDRAVAARNAERAAARTGCARVARMVSEIGLRAVQNALRCLARKNRSALPSHTGAWRQTSIKLRGEINAARIWALLRTQTSGRIALLAAAQRHARIVLRTSDQSWAIVRAAR